MQRGYAMVRDAVKECPLPLLDLTGKLREYADSFLPFDTGIEIECEYNFLKEISNPNSEIPFLKQASFDGKEKRFRIPNGVKGLVCLYYISEFCKKRFALNPLSGIHYHIDFTEFSMSEFNYLYSKVQNNQQWILNSLKSWNYTGKFNEWKVSALKTAVRFHGVYRTLEFRIGEMTFDYKLLVKRIIHAQNISKKVKKNPSEEYSS